MYSTLAMIQLYTRKYPSVREMSLIPHPSFLIPPPAPPSRVKVLNKNYKLSLKKEDVFDTGMGSHVGLKRGSIFSSFNRKRILNKKL